MLNRYALADYQLTVKVSSNINIPGISGESFTIGGPASTSYNSEGSQGGYIGDITISRKASMWTTDSDYTGGYVHVKNLDRTGTAKVSLNQLSDNIIRLNTIFSLCEARGTSENEAITLIVTNSATNKVVATCTDCRIVKQPDQVFANSPTMQAWEFTCGIVDIVYE